MSEFATKLLPREKDDVAPDGSDVRVLLGLAGGGMAHFELAPGKTSGAVTHRTIGEIWFFLSGSGEMWLKQGDREEVVSVEQDVCLTIPPGMHFQFRSFGDEPLSAIGVTMPPWPVRTKRSRWRGNGKERFENRPFRPGRSRARLRA